MTRAEAIATADAALRAVARELVRAAVYLGPLLVAARTRSRFPLHQKKPQASRRAIISYAQSSKRLSGSVGDGMVGRLLPLRA